MKVTLGMSAALLFAAAIISPAQAVVIGVADGANSIPFGSTTGGYYYQQVYNAAGFNSPMGINQITFYDSLYPGGTSRGGTFDIYLSTTNAAISTFDTSNGVAVPYYSDTFTNVFHGVLPVTADGRLDFNLSALFNYDPTQGNLLLTIRSFDLFEGNGFFLDVDKNNGITNSRFSAYPYDWNQGLVTGFNDSIASAVPEPSTWAMMILGFVSVGIATLRRRRSDPGIAAA